VGHGVRVRRSRYQSRSSAQKKKKTGCAESISESISSLLSNKEEGQIGALEGGKHETIGVPWTLTVKLDQKGQRA